MKRRQPLKRVKGLETRMDQVLAWQRRTQDKAAAAKRTTKRREKRQRKKRNDAQWREEVMALRGPACRACGDTGHVECDHLIERSQGGPSIPENGLPLCGEFGACRAHVRKTNNELQIQRSWLDPDQVAWLAEQGYAEWLPDGTVTGRFWKTFAAVHDTEGSQ